MAGKTVKFKPSTWTRADALVHYLSQNEDLKHALGGVIGPADVLRIAVERGLAAIEHEARPEGDPRRMG